MKQAKAELLLHEIAAWQQEQRIDAATAERLAQRYRQPGGALEVALRWLALSGVLLVGGTLFGVVKLMADAALPANLMLAAFAIGMIYFGVRMSSNVTRPYPVTGAAITTLGLLAVFVLAALLVGDGREALCFSLFVPAAISLAVAYRYALRWPLLLGLLAIFHAIGSRSAYMGSGSYFADIADPPIMAVIGFAAAALGTWHLHAEDGVLARYAGFGRLYLILGLLYGNLSLLLMSIEVSHDDAGWWIAGFTLACIAEIVLGGRFKDGRFTGFGIVFLGIDIYTRFYEHAWDRLGAGPFLLLGGLVALLLGFVFEWRGRRTKATSAEVTP